MLVILSCMVQSPTMLETYPIGQSFDHLFVALSASSCEKIIRTAVRSANLSLAGSSQSNCNRSCRWYKCPSQALILLKFRVDVCVSFIQFSSIIPNLNILQTNLTFNAFPNRQASSTAAATMAAVKTAASNGSEDTIALRCHGTGGACEVS